MARRKFLRSKWRTYSKLGRGRKKKQVYRKPKGIHKKMKQKMKGNPRRVSIGFKKQKKEMEKITRVMNLKDLLNLNKKDKIIIGVNMFHLFKLINTIDNDDTLTIYIENADYVDGIVSHLALKFENGDIKQCKTQKLRLIEPEMEELQYPNVKFSSIINLPSSDFQKIIRDLSCISDKLEIKSIGNELIFKCSGQFASAEIHRAESDGNMSFILKQDSTKIIQGEFSLKNLGYFIKCTNLCSQIEVYLENDLPLVVKYDVASLGSIMLCLASLPSS